MPHPPLPRLSRIDYDLHADYCKQPLAGPAAGRDTMLLLDTVLEPLTPDCTQYWLDDHTLELDLNLDPHSLPSLAQPPCKTAFWSRQYEYTETLPWRLLLYASLLEALAHNQTHTKPVKQA